MSNAKSQAQSMGGTQGPADQRSNDKNRAETTGTESTGSGVISGRATRDDRAQSFRIGIVFGGIVGQLIADAENRLAEMEECVGWYQREVEKSRQRLQELRALSTTISQELSE